jgi:hypothetical protein
MALVEHISVTELTRVNRETWRKIAGVGEMSIVPGPQHEPVDIEYHPAAVIQMRRCATCAPPNTLARTVYY